MEYINHYKAQEEYTFKRKEDDFIMGEAIDLGVSDSIDNYKDVPFTEDSYKEFYESIGVEIHKSREVDEI